MVTLQAHSDALDGLTHELQNGYGSIGESGHTPLIRT